MFKRILVAIDGSLAAAQGLECAIELAADQHATLYVVHVINDALVAPNLGGGLVPAEYFEGMIESLRATGRELIGTAKALARKRGLEANALVVEMYGRSVAETILAQANKRKADVIVLGTHGRRGLRRLVLGSDAEAVLHESAVPVLLVRGPEQVNPDTRPARRGGRPW